DEAIDLVAGSNYERSIEIRTGRVVVELPATLERPEYGSVIVFGSGGGGAFMAEAFTEAAHEYSPSREIWSSSTIELEDVAVSIDHINISVSRAEPMPDSQFFKLGKWTPIRDNFRVVVAIKDGETTRVVVP